MAEGLLVSRKGDMACGGDAQCNQYQSLFAPFGKLI